MGSYSNVSTPVYDIDGDDATFSDAELQVIQSTWARVAEDFAPFNINVTTEEPAVLASGMPIAAANGIALRVAIGGSSMDWYGSVGVNGTGYVNDFTNSIANVVYVFSNNGSGSPLGDLASHEAGHGFGLQHQSLYDANGVKLEEYNPGEGSWRSWETGRRSPPPGTTAPIRWGQRCCRTIWPSSPAVSMASACGRMITAIRFSPPPQWQLTE